MLLSDADTDTSAEAATALTTQQALASFHRQLLTPALPHHQPPSAIDAEMSLRASAREFLDRSRLAVAEEARECPTAGDAFVAWFLHLKDVGPGQGDPLFAWLEERADYAQMRWFIAQEVSGEAGFDDLVALTQVKAPAQAKLEMARNFWDEMGRGIARNTHGYLLERIARTMHLDLMPRGPVLLPVLELTNLMIGMASTRAYAYHAMGALGIIELTAPQRVACIANGLQRLGFSSEQRRYYDLHAALDPQHASSWITEVLLTVIAGDAAIAHAVAEGALMRLHAGARCAAAYRQALAVPVTG
jgi:hypothetical protein